MFHLSLTYVQVALHDLMEIYLPAILPGDDFGKDTLDAPS
jgi:hypothetical protein